jgi:hypothetical protein
MLTTKGGHKVGKGTYWDLRKGHRVDISHEGVLPGDETVNYFRISSGIMLLLVPIVGLLYAVLMPIIGIATVAAFIARKVLGGMYNLVAKSISFGWQPMNAYLSGKKKKKKEKK